MEWNGNKMILIRIEMECNRNEMESNGMEMKYIEWKWN
jgi:hypothetical protein